MKKTLWILALRSWLFALCSMLFAGTLAAVYVILDPDSGIVINDDLTTQSGAQIAFKGDFPRYVVQRERTADGARSTLLVYASKLMARAAAENPPEGWETIPVEPWQIDRLTSRTGVRHVSLVNGE